MVKFVLSAWNRQRCLDVIKRAELWFACEGIELYRDGRYPRVPIGHKFATRRHHAHAWHIDCLMSVAYYLLEGDLIVAMRVYMVACEHKGEAGTLADSSWYDEHSHMSNAIQDCVNAVGGPNE